MELEDLASPEALELWNQHLLPLVLQLMNSLDRKMLLQVGMAVSRC